MRKIHRSEPDVDQRVANMGAELIEQCLAAYGVRRACELPEEGRVRLARDLARLFADYDCSPPLEPPPRPRHWLARLAGRLGLTG